jgi:hypothetical protein
MASITVATKQRTHCFCHQPVLLRLLTFDPEKKITSPRPSRLPRYHPTEPSLRNQPRVQQQSTSTPQQIRKMRTSSIICYVVFKLPKGIRSAASSTILSCTPTKHQMYPSLNLPTNLTQRHVSSPCSHSSHPKSLISSYHLSRPSKQIHNR